MVNLKILTIVSLLLVLLVGVTSAQTLVAGKIYTADFSETIADVSVHVVCNSYFLDTISLSDGTYAVRFEEIECNESDVVDITASKSGFNTKTTQGIINKCNSGDCGGNYFTIINLGLEVKLPEDDDDSSSGGGGGSSRYYLCGNGICDSGETINTCPQDCPFELLTYENTGDYEEKEEIIITQEETPQTAFSKITGAVTGTLRETGIWMAGIFILIIIGILGIAKFRKRK